MHQFLYTHLLQRLNEENTHLNRIKLYPYSSTGELKWNLTGPGTVMLLCDPEIIRYYTWFLAKKGVRLEYPKFSSHISVLRDEPYAPGLEGSSEGAFVTFSYGDLVTNGKHWWLEVKSPALDAFRRRLGLPEHRRSGFHLTLGRIITRSAN